MIRSRLKQIALFAMLAFGRKLFVVDNKDLQRAAIVWMKKNGLKENPYEEIVKAALDNSNEPRYTRLRRYEGDWFDFSDIEAKLKANKAAVVEQ